MCTINMTFDVPDSKYIDIDALKNQINDFFHVIISRPSVLKRDVNHSWTEEFRGKWQDDNMTAEEFVKEIRMGRTYRNVVEL